MSMRLAASETVGEEARKGIAASWFWVRGAGISISFCRILSLFIAKGCAGLLGRRGGRMGLNAKRGRPMRVRPMCYISTYVR